MHDLLQGAQQLVHDLDQSSGLLKDSSSGGALQPAGSRQLGMLPMPAAATSLTNTIKTVRQPPAARHAHISFGSLASPSRAAPQGSAADLQQLSSMLCA